MQYPDVLTVNVRLFGLATIAILFLAVFLWPYLRPKRRKRPVCELSPLEVRAHDAVIAIDELEAAITALAEQKRPLPTEVTPAWIKVKTAGFYLKRFLEEGR